MTDKKWYSIEDIELAKAALSEMPDLTPTRLTKSAVLEQLKEQIVELSLKKGYSVEEKILAFSRPINLLSNSSILALWGAPGGGRVKEKCHNSGGSLSAGGGSF